MKSTIRNVIIGLVSFTLFYFGTSYFLRQTRQQNAQRITTKIVDYMTKDDWVKFNSIEGKFNLTFPKYPQSSENQVNGPNNTKIKLTQYTSSDTNKNFYMAQVAEYLNVDMSKFNIRQGLEGTVNGSVASTKENSLVKSEYMTLYEQPGVVATIFNSKEKIYMHSRNFFKDNRLFSLMVSSTTEPISSEAQKFFDSFGFN